MTEIHTASIAAGGGRLVVMEPGEATNGKPAVQPSLCEARVVANDHVTDRYWRLRLNANTISAGFEPGQFVMLTVPGAAASAPTLPRPMAIFAADAGAGVLEIVYGVVGSGTRQLSTVPCGATMTTVGPVGRGFKLHPDTRRILIVGRGIGACSLTALAAEAVRKGLHVVAVDSGRTTDALVGYEAYTAAGASDVYYVVDEDGTSDPEALRSRLLSDHTKQSPEQIFVCGSERLTRLCGDLAGPWAADVQVSIEARMACGLGYCHGCSSGQRTTDAEAPLVCRDGPVFRWLPDPPGRAANHA